MKPKRYETVENWHEVERALEENTISGFKMACIEAEKNLIKLLQSKGFPNTDLLQTTALFGWKLTNMQALKDAIAKVAEIKSSFDYRLSSFEAEDTVEAFKQAIEDFTNSKPLNFQAKSTLFFDHYFTFKKGSALKRILGFTFLTLFLIKMLSATTLGRSVVNSIVSLADLLFSWSMIVILLTVGIFTFMIVTFVTFDKKKTKIKSIKER